MCRCSCHALRCIAWFEGIVESQCFRNEFEHTNDNKLQQAFAVFHGLCMLKVSTNDVSVVEVSRRNSRNVKSGERF